MPADIRFRLSRLQPLDQYLAQGIDIDSGLANELEAALPPKQVDKLVKLLDTLLQEPRGAQVLALTMTYLLQEWVKESDEVLSAINQDLDPYTWLATNDHLEVVLAFRALL
jgi:hypothetical protein